MRSKRQRSNAGVGLDPGPNGLGFKTSSVHPAEVSLSKLLDPTRQTGALFCSCSLTSLFRAKLDIHCFSPFSQEIYCAQIHILGHSTAFHKILRISSILISFFFPYLCASSFSVYAVFFSFIFPSFLPCLLQLI